MTNRTRSSLSAFFPANSICPTMQAGDVAGTCGVHIYTKESLAFGSASPQTNKPTHRPQDSPFAEVQELIFGTRTLRAVHFAA